MPPAWQGRSVAGPKLRLVNMAAFVELTAPVDMFSANAVRTTNVTVVPSLQLRFDYDPTTTYRARLLPIRCKQKIERQFFVAVVS